MRLIVTNGDAAVERMRAAGIDGEILPWRDVLHDGPVTDEEQLERLSQLRAAFIAKEFGVPHEEVALSFAERDSTIRRHAEFDRIELWLEHDLYDQLQLIQVLHFLAEEKRIDGVYLVQADDYLGVQSEGQIRKLAEMAAPVTIEQFELACHAWRAFTSSDPTVLVAFAAHDIAALPYLKPALLRLLAEFPDPIRGLSLTEERVLQRLEEGPTRRGELFKAVVAQEDASFMGDASFFRRVDGLTFVPEPLVEGVEVPYTLIREPEKDTGYKAFADAILRLTPAGRRVLAGRLDHAMTNDVDRWIGGTRLRPALLLRYDRNAGELIAPR
ncbi:hypothetical protein [Flaviflagellibacter deserti]|uniref:DUF1835 domain-containing protein n=1 Tax=Flaviflagellibacter deserti TaxID=2267266 RepID=A0ABV9Z401_9HYPH